MRRRMILTIAAVLIATAGGSAWRLSEAPAKPEPAARTIPVTMGVAGLKDVPVYLTGLGTVQAFNTVAVKVRVDGQLDQVLFSEGQDVKAGQVLAKIDARAYQAQLVQARAKKQLDEAHLANARLNLQRYLTLVQTNAVPVQQVDTQRAMVAQLEAQVELDQGAIDNAQTFVDYCTITSPIDGRTGLRLVDRGNIVHAADPNGLVVITQLQPISVIFTLPESQLREVIKSSSGETLKVIASARSDQHELAEGTLELVDNQIDQSTGTVRLKATFPNTNRALWPGQFVDVRLLLRTIPDAVTVPATAIQRGPDGLYVYSVDETGHVRMRPVSVEQMADGTAVVESGLQAGTRIVVSGQYRLQPGSPVEATSRTAHSSGKS
jgi:multidrug efflux system membrane fusion protein